MKEFTPQQVKDLHALPVRDLIHYWDEFEKIGRDDGKFDSVVRTLVKADLYYLLVRVCGRVDLLPCVNRPGYVDNQFAFDRCREVEANPNGYLDLWAREHWKTSVITFGLTLQDILKDPEVTVGIMSHTRPIAKAFLRMLMREIESNRALHAAFPDVLVGSDVTQYAKFSEDDGVILKRKSNPNEATVEAWGLVDGSPVSKHWKILVYDDVVVQGSVSTPEMIQKTMTALELSYNLGTTGGARRMAGTRYHFNDAYKTVIDRGTFKAREYPGRVGGTEDGESIVWSDEQHRAKRTAQGPYVYACLPADAPILMADFVEKRIADVKPGDAVVGYVFPPRAKARIRPSRVLAVHRRRAEVFEYTLSSGRKVRCTEQHNWYTGRRGKDVGGTDGHRAYAPLAIQQRTGRDGYVSHLVSLYDPRRVHAPFDADAAAWLSGFYDGEGSSSGHGVHFHQSEKYPHILRRLEQNLRLCGLDFGMTRTVRKQPKWHPARDYYLRGGRSAHIRFLNIAKPAKWHSIVHTIFKNDARSFHGSKHNRDKAVSRNSLGVQPVYAIETDTGNYVAYGYASKNSQILLNPKADAMQGFKREWLRYYSTLKPRGMNGYFVIDSANSKRKESDYTSMWLVLLGVDGNYYGADMVRDRLNLTERTQRLIDMHRRWRDAGVKIQQVRWERYGMAADIQALKTEQEKQNYRFDVTEVAGVTSKDDRIKRLIPIFEQGRFYLPKSKHVTDWQKNTVDLVHSFIEEEYYPFPVGLHKDMLDSLARIAEPDLKLVWPKEAKVEYVPPPQPLQHTETAWMA